jgi:hypothetical protein
MTKSKRYFAADNTYASDTSTGFANTWYVLAFNSRAARDEWVEQENAPWFRRSIARCSVLKRDVTNYLSDMPARFTPQFIGIDDRHPESFHVDYSEVDGCLGHVCTISDGAANSMDSYRAARLYS